MHFEARVVNLFRRASEFWRRTLSSLAGLVTRSASFTEHSSTAPSPYGGTGNANIATISQSIEPLSAFACPEIAFCPCRI
jgi:hypothetical protein